MVFHLTILISNLSKVYLKKVYLKKFEIRINLFKTHKSSYLSTTVYRIRILELAMPCSICRQAGHNKTTCINIQPLVDTPHLACLTLAAVFNRLDYHIAVELRKIIFEFALQPVPTTLHPFLTPATHKMVIDAGLEMEATFWTHQTSTWACVREQFQNMVIALAQHGQLLTPTLATNPPDFVVEFEHLAIHPRSTLTVYQAARQLEWTQSPAHANCWWGKVAGGWGNYRFHGGIEPRAALNGHIKRLVVDRNGLIPWWGYGKNYDKIVEMRAVGRTQLN